MQTYKNDYSKKEDYALWELHEIRNKMAKEKFEIALINESAAQLISRYQLKNVKLLKRAN